MRQATKLGEKDEQYRNEPDGATHDELSVFFQHDFGGFDDRRNRVAYFQFHLLGTPPGNDAFNPIVANFHRHMGHDAAELQFNDLSWKTVPRR
ncbi:MAG TPA: hypothetical protein VKE24_13790 [Candidatus Acidoferrales bacterium]|nr:hypothetical protein [Candidatus Acidoferrales bacterium]